MTTTSQPLDLHGIVDPLAFVEAIVQEHIRRVPYFSPDQAEELHAFLSLALVETAARYDRAKSPSGQAFTTYAGRILRFRITDWYRDEMGDSRYGGNATVEPLTDEDRASVAGWVTEPEIREAINTAVLTPAGRRTLNELVVPMIEEGRSAADMRLTLGVLARGQRKTRDALTELRKELRERCQIAA